MPRIARIKRIDAIYHIMSRSISELSLFKDKKDKDKYLYLMSKYKFIFQFKVYAYCLMTTHVHLEIDCCGADISKIMKSINQSYVAYYNKKYNRHGHLFQDRFNSKIVNSIDYLLTLSSYIHNNSRNINKYEKNIASYSYSSLGTYVGKQPNKYGIITTEYILSFFSKNNDRINSYFDFVNNHKASEKPSFEFVNQGSTSKNERQLIIRDCDSKTVIEFLSKYTDRPINIHAKFNHSNSEMRSIFVLIMRCLGNYSFKKICSIVGNITIPNLWRLSENGYKLITLNDTYKNVLEDFIKEHGNIQIA
ncbi:MAG TPA: transposase [Clostridiaceae bacterium]